MTDLSLHNYYKDRLDTAWKSLESDIQAWVPTDTPKTLIEHHLLEFQEFCAGAFNALTGHLAQESTTSVAPTAVPSMQGSTEIIEVEDFRALVIGVLTTKWSVLRQVAMQRASGTPYGADLEKLDERATLYYHRLRNALPPTLADKFYRFAPVVYLGRMSELTIFSRNVPLVISIPFGAQHEARSALAIPHEVGHAIMSQMPEFLPQLTKQVSNALDQGNGRGARRRQVLNNMVINWLEEIVADMIGTALAGREFADSAIWITATSEANYGITDATHPPSLVRSYIHATTLDHLKTPPDVAQYTQISEALKRSADQKLGEQVVPVHDLVAEHLNRQFKSIPALTFVTMEEVRDVLVRVVELLLDDTISMPPILEGESYRGFLLRCATTDAPIYQNEFQRWGDLPAQEGDQFALDLPTSLGPDFATPAMKSFGVCCYIPALAPICC